MSQFGAKFADKLHAIAAIMPWRGKEALNGDG
jgi:hypothetical protein